MSTALHKLMDAVDADSFEPAAVYELDLPKERQSVLDDRRDRGLSESHRPQMKPRKPKTERNRPSVRFITIVIFAAKAMNLGWMK
jgi:hypothetical protein